MGFGMTKIDPHLSPSGKDSGSAALLMTALRHGIAADDKMAMPGPLRTFYKFSCESLGDCPNLTQLFDIGGLPKQRLTQTRVRHAHHALRCPFVLVNIERAVRKSIKARLMFDRDLV